MHSRFATILDRYPGRKPPAPDALAESRALWLSTLAQRSERIPEISQPLLDPLLLAALRITLIERNDDQATIDLIMRREPNASTSCDYWGGPVRLMLDDVCSIECSKGSPSSISPDDHIVWGELHAPPLSPAPPAPSGPLTLILRLASGLRVRIETGSIRFASIGLPC